MKLRERVKELLRKKHTTISKFEEETGIHRSFFLQSRGLHRPRKATLMAIAYYFGMRVEDLVAGTDAEEIWYS